MMRERDRESARAKKAEPETAVEVAVEAPDLNAADLLRKAGIYYVWGEIIAGGLKDIHQDILLKHYLGPKKYNSPIQIILNSIGGDLDEASALIDLLSNLRLKVATAGFGTCASAAAMLLACGTRGLRTVAPSCEVMIHVYSWSANGSHHELVAHRKAEDDEYEREVDYWIRHSNYATRKGVERYLLRKEDNYFTAKEAVKHGIADRVSGVLR